MAFGAAGECTERAGQITVKMTQRHSACYYLAARADSSLGGALGGEGFQGAQQTSYNTSQYHSSTEQIAIRDDPSRIVMPLHAQTHQVCLSRNLRKQTHRYKVFFGKYSTLLVHPEPTTGIEEVEFVDASTSAPPTSRLYDVTSRYKGNKPSRRLWSYDKPLERHQKGEVKEEGSKKGKKGANERCLICSSSKKSCLTELGGLCL
ncbi:hypothetical protein OBBRIDRAFT_242489 [Obba rivulosa]|uniref:Uncharacterized protein n=1 Tax=Obba rivulosa TaxID=1052685 RepID=A0A8E2AKX0_9APHY|nr:hypothetical protein OBBRIDRAFT_242489 [Obba rivulosa]